VPTRRALGGASGRRGGVPAASMSRSLHASVSAASVPEDGSLGEPSSSVAQQVPSVLGGSDVMGGSQTSDGGAGARSKTAVGGTRRAAKPRPEKTAPPKPAKYDLSVIYAAVLPPPKLFQRARRPKSQGGQTRAVRPMTSPAAPACEDGPPVLSPRLLGSEALQRTAGGDVGRAARQDLRKNIAKAQLEARAELDKLDPAYSWETDVTSMNESLLSEEGSRTLAVPLAIDERDEELDNSAGVEQEPEEALERLQKPEVLEQQEQEREHDQHDQHDQQELQQQQQRQHAALILAAPELLAPATSRTRPESLEAIAEEERAELKGCQAEVDRLRVELAQLSDAGAASKHTEEAGGPGDEELLRRFEQTIAQLRAARARVKSVRVSAERRREQRRRELEAASRRTVQMRSSAAEAASSSARVRESIEKRAAAYHAKLLERAAEDQGRERRVESEARAGIERLGDLLSFIDRELSEAPRADLSVLLAEDSIAGASLHSAAAAVVAAGGVRAGPRPVPPFGGAGSPQPRSPTATASPDRRAKMLAPNPPASLAANLPRSIRDPGARGSKLQRVMSDALLTPLRRRQGHGQNGTTR
jgi:hypothetical protein